MLFNVPGARSSPLWPPIVTLPGLAGCLYCRWLPFVATRYQPSASRSFMTSRTFILIYLHGYLNVIRKFAESRQRRSIIQFDNCPFIKNFFQVSAAFLKGFAGSPHTLKFGNFSIIRSFVIDYFVFCPFKSCVVILDKYDHIFPNMIYLILCGINLI